MVDTNVSETIRLAAQQTAQVPETRGAGFLVLSWLSKGSEMVSPWWSKQRDLDLRNFVKQSDHLSGAIYTAEAKLSSIDWQILPRDPSNYAQVQEAADRTTALRHSAELGQGMVTLISKAVECILSQDNGVFIEVIGPGPKDGPLIDAPTSLRVLDSWRCNRTGDPIFPVVFLDSDGSRYKFHFSRIIFGSQMASDTKEMMDVGFCGVSRAVNIAQTLIDQLVYKQEMLGSRPKNQMMITGGGLDPEDIQEAFQLAEISMDNQGLTRMSKTVVTGSRTIPDGKVQTVDFHNLPQGWDEEKVNTIGIAIVAMALGMDARDLFPGIGAGATRADAMLAHMKQRGKFPGQFIQWMEQQLDAKFCPPYLYFRFDFQDDAQDRQVAEINQIRSTTRTGDLKNETINVRIAREQMMRQGELDRSQFEMMEFEDGRLEDGAPILTVFYSRDALLRRLASLAIPDPLDFANNDPAGLFSSVVDKALELNRIIATTKNFVEKWQARKVLIALRFLVKLYGPGAVDPTLYSQVKMLTGDPKTSLDNPFANPALPGNPIGLKPGSPQDQSTKPGPRQADGSANEQGNPSDKKDPLSPRPQNENVPVTNPQNAT